MSELWRYSMHMLLRAWAKGMADKAMDDRYCIFIPRGMIKVL